jgi:hypothetical protein
MALAARRLLLRASAYSYRRSRQLQLSLSSPLPLPLISNTRSLQTTHSRWAGPKASSRPLPPGYNLRSDPEYLALDKEQKKWVAEFADRIESSGDIGPALDMLDRADMEPKDKLELLGLLNKLEGMEEKEQHYQELAEALNTAPDDSAAIEAILEKLGKTSDEMMEMTEEEKKEMEELGVDPDDKLLPSLALRATDKANANNARVPSLAEAEENLRPSFWKRWFGGKDDKESDELRRLSKGEMARDKALWTRDPRFNEMYGIINDPSSEKEKEEAGFWNYGDETEGMGEDEEFKEDDITSKGHAQLEQHREIRQYARWAVWEMPLLSSTFEFSRYSDRLRLTFIELAQPFEYPGDDQVLRFRYTTYFGEEHPASSKVVVEWSPEDIPKLTQIQKNKLIKLAGVRYNPETKVIKISCESFETQAQNKRYLGDLVEMLIKEAKDAKDTFEDIPFDFRHHKPKVFHAFPEEWKLTPERKAEIDAKRQTQLETEKVVDGLLTLPGGLEERRIKEELRAEQIEVNVAAKQAWEFSMASKLSPALIMDHRARRQKVYKTKQ